MHKIFSINLLDHHDEDTVSAESRRVKESSGCGTKLTCLYQQRREMHSPTSAAYTQCTLSTIISLPTDFSSTFSRGAAQHGSGSGVKEVTCGAILYCTVLYWI